MLANIPIVDQVPQEEIRPDAKLARVDKLPKPTANFLQSLSLADVVAVKPETAPKKLCDVPADATLLDALQTMRQDGISCIAVYGKKGHWLGAGETMICTKEKQYIGLVTVLDIILHLSDPAHLAPNRDPLTTPISTLIGASDEGRSLWVGRTDVPLPRALEPMAKGVHRLLVPVTLDPYAPASGLEQNANPATVPPPPFVAACPAPEDPTPDHYALVSQSDLCRLLHMRLTSGEDSGGDPLLNALANDTLSEVNVPIPEPYVVHASDLILPALSLMAQSRLRAVPVVNAKTRQIEATLSVSDFGRAVLGHLDGGSSAVSQAVWSMKGMTVGQFLQWTKGGSEAWGPGIVCGRDEKLSVVLARLVESGVHRLWVIEGEGKAARNRLQGDHRSRKRPSANIMKRAKTRKAEDGMDFKAAASPTLAKPKGRPPTKADVAAAAIAGSSSPKPARRFSRRKAAAVAELAEGDMDLDSDYGSRKGGRGGRIASGHSSPAPYDRTHTAAPAAEPADSPTASCDWTPVSSRWKRKRSGSLEKDVETSRDRKGNGKEKERGRAKVKATRKGSRKDRLREMEMDAGTTDDDMQDDPTDSAADDPARDGASSPMPAPPPKRPAPTRVPSVHHLAQQTLEDALWPATPNEPDLRRARYVVDGALVTITRVRQRRGGALIIIDRGDPPRVRINHVQPNAANAALLSQHYRQQHARQLQASQRRTSGVQQPYTTKVARVAGVGRLAGGYSIRADVPPLPQSDTRKDSAADVGSQPVLHPFGLSALLAATKKLPADPAVAVAVPNTKADVEPTLVHHVLPGQPVTAMDLLAGIAVKKSSDELANASCSPPKPLVPNSNRNVILPGLPAPAPAPLGDQPVPAPVPVPPTDDHLRFLGGGAVVLHPHLNVFLRVSMHPLFSTPDSLTPLTATVPSATAAPTTSSAVQKPLDIPATATRLGELCAEERRVCGAVGVLPKHYLEVKEALLAAIVVRGPVMRRDAVRWFVIDGGRAGRLFDWFNECGWLRKASKEWERRERIRIARGDAALLEEVKDEVVENGSAIGRAEKDTPAPTRDPTRQVEGVARPAVASILEVSGRPTVSVSRVE
ncbi:hypothetical protein HK101_010309 [Irineochytrium annulatum]|nr:hypothetical protein HK101_010309 [Irineochytrium annulatum]